MTLPTMKRKPPIPGLTLSNCVVEHPDSAATTLLPLLQACRTEAPNLTFLPMSPVPLTFTLKLLSLIVIPKHTNKEIQQQLYEMESLLPSLIPIRRNVTRTYKNRIQPVLIIPLLTKGNSNTTSKRMECRVSIIDMKSWANNWELSYYCDENGSTNLDSHTPEPDPYLLWS